jgi:hypothetical protein
MDRRGGADRAREELSYNKEHYGLFEGVEDDDSGISR